jgi:hypothetical protein
VITCYNTNMDVYELLKELLVNGGDAGMKAYEDFMEGGEASFYFVGEGLGIYEGETEASLTVVFDTNQKDLEDWLRLLAIEYQQDAIALTEGETKFITKEEKSNV